jgi:hypothetical protein
MVIDLAERVARLDRVRRLGGDHPLTQLDGCGQTQRTPVRPVGASQRRGRSHNRSPAATGTGVVFPSGARGHSQALSYRHEG